MALLALAGFKSWGGGQETIEIGDGNNISYHFPFSSYYNFTTPDCWDGHTINYTLNDSYDDGWDGANLTIVDKINNYTIKTLTLSGSTESGSLTLCSGTYDFVWHTGSYDDECSFSISENEETLFTCDNASAYTDGEVVYTLDLLEKFAITLNQPEDAAVGTISADYEQAAAGTTVTLSTDFNLGYTLNYFMVDGVQIVGNTFEMPEHDVTVSVAYNTLDMYAITFDPEIDDDIISVSATYNGEPVTEAPAGTVITLSYSNLDEGYTFNYWTLNGAQLTGSTFEMPEEDAKIGVNLTERERYDVTIDSDVQDYITADPSSDILGGTTVTLTISPATGYVLTELHVLDEGENEQDVTITENSNIRTFIMPESNVTVSAVFSPVYNVSIDMALVGGSISQMSTQGTLTAYPAGTQVFLFANPDEDYSFVEDSFIVIRSDGEIGPTVTYTNMMYSFIMPESNVTVSATFNKTAFAVSQVITPMSSGSFAIDKTAHVGIGETVTLSYFNASPGYYFDFEDVNSLVVKRNDNQETVEVNNYDNIYQFAMPTSDVTVTATFKELPRYSVFVGDVVNGTIYLYDPYQNILAGDIIYFNVEPETGYTLESITVTPEEGNPFEPTQQYDFYYFTMPSSNVTISATFCELQSYTINYYVNGELDRTMQCYEDRFVNNDGPQTVPTGMTFEGWGFAEIDPYTTEKPAVLGNAEYPTQNYNLYAVLSYTESVQSGETWKKVTSTSELSAGDEIVLVYGNYVMGGLWGTEDYHRCEVSIANNEISNLPSNANVLTLVASGNNWKLQYFESEISNTTTLSYIYNYTRDCLTYYGYGNSCGCISYDEWTAIESSGVMFYNNTYSKYIGNHPNGNFITVVDRTNTACKAYKKYITNTYYMTEVLADGEVTENTTAKNIIITTGTVTVDNNIVLTMNENGLFRNEDAADFVFEDGAQLIYDGDETVNATMKKNINCNASKASNVNWYTISSPLAAKNTAFADVTNLIPNNDIAGTDYDLYRFDEANGMWINSRIYGTDGTTIIANPDFTTIDKGVGYIYHNNADTKLEFKGEINVNNVTGVSLTLTADKGKGYNLIGNPFTQNITLANVKSDETAELAEGFYVLNNDNTWGAKLTESEIKPLQGFLVQAKTAGDVTINKPTSSSKGERSNEQNTSIEVIVSNSNHRDNAYAMFGEGTGLNKVNHRNAQAPMLYIPQDGEDFAIAFMNENTTVFPVSFKAMTTGKYSISLKATDDISTLVLVDNMTGTETNMLLEDSYTFIGSPADNENRFTVKLGISHNSGQTDNEHFVYQNGKELVVNGEGTLQVFDVLGRVVVSEEVHGQTVNVGGLTTGAYIVRMTGNEVKTQKIIVR
ncbi:MAG: T9SS type A sorting domain-containing protein [bacterium]|nr:T9SS type A sorting domain-containing protein [Candidatus Limimorpha caballi]